MERNDVEKFGVDTQVGEEVTLTRNHDMVFAEMITIGLSAQFHSLFLPAWRKLLGKGVDRRPSLPYEFVHSPVHLVRFPCDEHIELLLKTVYCQFP